MDTRVLGPLEVLRDGEPVRIGSRMQRRLLALLLVSDGDWVRPERMIDVLWGDQAPRSAPKGLQTYVSRLRRSLGDGAEIVSDVHGYRLRVDEIDLDARRFEQLVSTARERLTDEPEAAAADLDEALALWRGPAYAEFADEDFARPEAVRLEDLRLAASEDAFAARSALDDAELVADLEAFAAANPLRERPHAQLMAALGRDGRQTDALEVYQRFRARLADELGLEPSPALQQLQADILQQAPGVTPTATGSGGNAGAGASSASFDGERVGNLPAPTTSVVGRDAAAAEVCRLLEDHRLVTLTGAGGVGKTRLALEVATRVAGQHPDGAWWVELAAADDDAVGHALAAVLGVQQQTDRSIVDSILGALVGKRLLLVLDNCEHVVETAAALTEQLRRNCREVTVLATSREPLATADEQVWLVPPLPLPAADDEAASKAASVQLFAERARAHRADFRVDGQTLAAVVDVCRQLDGLPLAIELAAALVPALEPEDIATRLGRRFGLLTRGSRTDPRHRSLAAVVEWSYQLLEPDERQLFDRLAVFAGGFTLDAAEDLCADEDLPRDRVAGVLAGLVRRSMVSVDHDATPARYRLLETLRQYAAQQLSERREEPTLHARHATWFVELAEQADVEVRGPGEAEAVALLEAELANLRVAHRWAVEHDDAGLALRLAVALHVFAAWRLRDEVFAWAEEAGGLPTADGHPLQPVALGVAARGTSNRGELARSRELAERALAAVPDEADPRRLAALDSLEATALYEGRLAECRALAEEALASARRHDDAYNAMQAQLHQALALIYEQQREAGLEAALALRAAADRDGNPHHRAWARYVHAEARGDDDPGEALQLLEEALAVVEPAHDRLLRGVARMAIAALRARHHSPREALPAFADVIRHWRRAGDWTHQWPTIRNVVPLLVELGADEVAAQLYGAQQAADTATPAYGDDADRLAETLQRVTSRLGTATAAAFIEQGEELGGAGAVDLALETVATLGAEAASTRR